VTGFELKQRQENGVTVIEVTGDLDVYTSGRLREAVIYAVHGGRYHLVIDLEGVTFCDAAGMGALVGALRRVRYHDGGFAVVCTGELILKHFRIAGLVKVLNIHGTAEAAVAALQAA
jgi:anti-sigma B factor antagonist